jgi:hypothetical protein
MFKVTCFAAPQKKLGLIERLILEVIEERLWHSVT